MESVAIYSWMTKALGLRGNSLLVFSYMFSNLVDQFHTVTMNLTDVSDWYGMSYRSVTTNVDNLIELGYITRRKVDNTLLRQYKLNVDKISTECIKSGKDYYVEFIDTYRDILMKKFPDDMDKINDILKDFIDDTGMCNPSILMLSNLISLSSFDEAKDCLNSTINIQNIPNMNKQYVVPEKTQDCLRLFDQPKKKRGRPSKKEANRKEKLLILEDFILMRGRGNAELKELLIKFLDTDAGRKYSPDQWKSQLDNLADCGITEERMIDGVTRSYMSGYKTLYLKPQFENDMSAKIKIIEDYVSSEKAPDDRLSDYLKQYVFETTKGKSYTKNQFRLALEKLSDVCASYEDKVASVRRSYENAYSALAYESQAQKSIDMDKKHELIHSFIADGYYYLVDGLNDVLYQYVDSTTAGSSMSASEFSVILENLRQFCFDDEDKVSRVRVAIQGNKNVFATEDFYETKKLRQAHESRSERAKSLDRSRKQRVIEYSRRNPNDIRVAEIISEVGTIYQMNTKSTRPNYL